MNTKQLEAAALSIRSLSMDGVEAAKSGHPGLPMGMAEFGAYLYGQALNHQPKDPKWINRDRFILSAGHGSMFIYSLLHLTGYGLPLEELKNFRQVGSLTPGHPEYGHTVGVETTTGPLGQGMSNAVGIALAEQMAGVRLNTPTHNIIDYYTYFLAGDGCMMEGITSEAASFAGHNKLGKLIGFYDSNHISIEGHTDLAFTEDVGKRFEAYGWQVLKGDAYDFAQMDSLLAKAKAETTKPSLIILTSIIGKGSPNKEGTHDVHGAPLGTDEIKLTRKNMGLSEDQTFFIHPDAVALFAERQKALDAQYKAWQDLFAAWKQANPDKAKLLDSMTMSGVEMAKQVAWPEFAVGESIATRSASGKTLNAVAAAIPALIGGSADLSPSNNTDIKGGGSISAKNYGGRIIHFGVREHAMAAITNGIALSDLFRPFCATFLVFSDYMRGAMRLSALMKVPVIYILTHDSIFVGEDGPTHQPVEHLAALRIIPGMTLLRPGDAQETAFAWKWALEKTDGPVSMALTRQNLLIYPKPAGWEANARKGAYVVRDGGAKPDLTLVATGSEVSLALAAADAATAAGGPKNIRVVSMISRETFIAQPKAWKDSIVPPGVRTIVAEIAVSSGWEGFVQDPEDLFCLDSFGHSGPGAKVATYFKRDQEHLVKLINKK